MKRLTKRTLFLRSMNITFEKYQGAGNDFVLIDNRGGDVALTTAQIALLCDRHFGIGADGLMLLQKHEDADFEMVYFNADGNESTMCGNGGRCIAAYAYKLGAAEKQMNFMAVDGMHFAVIKDHNAVALQMQDVAEIEFGDGYEILNTGSPHYIQWVPSVAAIDVFNEGRNIRNKEAFQPKGINVNFVNRNGNGLVIRTYERGVEDETLACGTGVTAAAIVSVGEQTGVFQIPVKAKGGDLFVSFEKTSKQTAENIILTGDAKFVFSGNIML